VHRVRKIVGDETGRFFFDRQLACNARDQLGLLRAVCGRGAGCDKNEAVSLLECSAENIERHAGCGVGSTVV